MITTPFRRGRLEALSAASLLAGLLGCAGETPVEEPSKSTDSNTESVAMSYDWPAQLTDLAQRARKKFQAPTISVEDARALDNALFVDVRTTNEIDVSVIPDSELLATDEVKADFESNPPGRPVIVYCTAGWRSAEYTKRLRDAGIEAWNLEGGICAWAVADLEIVDSEGRPTRKIHSFSSDFAECVPTTHEPVTDS